MTISVEHINSGEIPEPGFPPVLILHDDYGVGTFLYDELADFGWDPFDGIFYKKSMEDALMFLSSDPRGRNVEVIIIHKGVSGHMIAEGVAKYVL